MYLLCLHVSYVTVVARQCVCECVCVHVCMLAVYVKCVCALLSYVCAHACVLLHSTLTEQQPMRASSLS